ncbi:hypothetical protein ACKKBF_B21500 [Auxenochlorella protothecoides x Auxenochlorella symbiontica]
MQWLDLVSSGVGRSPSGPENGTSPPRTSQGKLRSSPHFKEAT